MEKPIVTKFLHTRMRVDDLDKTVDFYKRIFGLKETRRSESPRGSKLVFLEVPNSEEEIEITYYPGSGPVSCQEDLVHLAFQVESMDAFCEHLDRIGEKLSHGPETTSSGSIIGFVDAPEGYEIEVIQRPS